MAKILVVDDEKSIRITIQYFLKKDGHDVQLAEDAITALELLKEAEFDVIVTDIILPKMSGVKLLEAIRGISPDVQVIMITGEPNLDTASEALRLGAFDYLAKPVNKEAILKSVTNAARSKALIDEGNRLEEENLNYRNNLAQLVEERTEALQESEDKYRDLIEQASDGIFICDHAGVLLEVNPAGRVILGYTDADPTGSNIRDFLERDNQGDDRLRLDDLAIGNGILQEYGVTREDGSKIQLEISAIRMSNNRIQGIVRDITERKQSEKALMDSEERFRKLSEAAFEGIVIVAKGKILEVNSELARMFGYEPSEIVGMSANDLTDPDYRDKVLSHIQSHSEATYEAVAVKKDGSTFPFEAHGTKIPYDGRIVRITAIRDISERKQAEEALLKSEARFRTLFETSPDGVIIDQNGILIYANPAYQKMFGIENLPDRLGQSYAPSIAPQDRKQVMAFSAAREAGEAAPGTYEFTGRRSDGTEFPAEVTAAFFEHGGQPATMAILRDITERKQAEEALAEKTMYLDNILRSSTEYGIATTDLDFRITYYNPMAEKLHGYKAEEVIGKTVPEMHTKEKVAPERFNLAIENIRRDGEHRYTIVKETEDGERYIDVRVSGIYASNGELEGYANFAKDITEQKQAEEALRKSEERYRSLVETSHDLIWRADKEGRIIYLNPAWKRTHGYEIEEMLGKRFTDFQHPEIAERDIKEFSKHLAGGSIIGYETSHISKSGEDVILLFNAIPLLDVGGNIIGTQGTASDITERKQAEEALRESESKFRDFFDNAPVGYHIFDSNGIIIDINSTELELLGYSREEIVGKKSWTDLIIPEQIPQFEVHWKLMNETGSIKNLEYTIKTKNDDLIMILLSASSRFDKTGSLINTRGSVLDVTKRKRAEAQLAQSTKLAAIGELAAGVAHEINNPLTNIYNYTQLLGKKLEGNEYVQERIQKIITNILRVRDITRGLTTLSRESTGNRMPVDITLLLTGIFEEIQLSWNRRDDLIIESNFQKDIPMCKVDEGQIRQVINNLVKNAIDAMPGGGTLTLASDYDLVNKSIRILVSDTGLGIPKSDLDKIFNPFFTTKAIGAGTGLGLSVSSSLIKQNGGDIAVESKEGHGTTFIISLPILGQSER